MGFWNKLGKIALTAAPYIAAPFTGGMSLMATGAANKAVGAWNQHDANEAAKKGLGPSSFDKYLGLAGDVAGGLSSVGALGKFGSGKYGGTGNTSYINREVGDVARSGQSGWQDKLRDILGGNNGSLIMDDPRNGGFSGRGGYGGFGGGTQGIASSSGNSGFGGILGGLLDKIGQTRGSNNGTATPQGYSRGNESGRFGVNNPRFNREARRGLGPIMGTMDQNNPNLAESISAGRLDAIRNQPWRGGYDVNTVGPNDEEGNPTVVTSNMPPVYPNGGRRRNRFTYASQ